MAKDKVDRTVEEALIEFQKNEIKPGMAPDKIMALYKKLTTENMIIEGKLLIMRATFYNVLQSEIQKENEAAERDSPLAQALNYLR